MAYHIWQVGVDIQNGLMRALAVQRRRQGWQLRHWWQIPLPADTLRGGSLHQSEGLCDVLTTWRRALPQRISLRVGFPTQCILQQRLAMPDRRVREPERSWYIENQAARHFPVDSESLTLDYGCEPQAPTQLLITAARRREVAAWQQCLQRAGLTPEVLDIVPCALRNMAYCAGLNPQRVLLHCLDGNNWLWVSPLSQPLTFGVILAEDVTQAEDIMTCVSHHYHGELGSDVYCSGLFSDTPPISTHNLMLWSPFSALCQIQPPLPQWPSLFVVAGGLALRPEDR